MHRSDDPTTWPAATLGELLRRAASAGPDRLALVDGEVRLSFAELEAHALTFAATLAGLGVHRGDVVTAQLPNWWETQVVTYGTALAGATYNPVVAIYREHELGFIVRQARPKVLVVPGDYRGHDHLAMACRLAAELDDPPVVVAVRVPETELPDQVLAFPGPGHASPSVAADPDDVALLMYTSGSTADPKGVLHSHRTLLHEARQVAGIARLGADDAVFMASPLTHITGLLFASVLPVDLGIACVLQDRWEAAAAVALVEQHHCTFTVSATTFLLGMTKVYEELGHRSSLEVFICGGAEVGPELVGRARQAMGTRIVRTYGSTEFPTFSLGDPYGDPVVAAETDGMPVPLSQHRIAPSEEHGETGGGELLVKGAELFLGYLDASLDASAFTEDGFFRTGDVVRFDERGACTVIGREKDIIIRGGENLSAIEVEDHLQLHPLIEEVAVVAMPDAILGERACAYVVPRGDGPTVVDLKAFLAARGLAVQKAPERVELVAALPRTASGKVQKYRLRATIRQRLSDEGA